MYSQHELDEAVASGVISADAADALRSHVERQRSLPAVDEEQFRLVTSFNDIFVSIAAAILLFAVAWIGQQAGQSAGLAVEGEGPSFLGPLAVAATAWGLALFFTARRRMALPSILLLLAFIGGVFVAEAVSVIIQVGYFKYTKRKLGEGKRFFRMAPIHHHFQKLGWPETKVVARFWVISLICALAGLGTLKLR